MSSQTVQEKAASDFAEVMKRDWNQRAEENSKWFINTVRLDQTEDEFDATGLSEIDALILPELVLLTGGRDPRELKFLEIGCGIGRMTKHLTSIFGEVHSTDVSGEMIRQAGQRLGHLSNVHLHETSGVDFVALPDDYFDVAFSAYVFQHVPDKSVIESNIREAYRVVKPVASSAFTPTESKPKVTPKPKRTPGRARLSPKLKLAIWRGSLARNSSAFTAATRCSAGR